MHSFMRRLFGQSESFITFALVVFVLCGLCAGVVKQIVKDLMVLANRFWSSVIATAVAAVVYIILTIHFGNMAHAGGPHHSFDKFMAIMFLAAYFVCAATCVSLVIARSKHNHSAPQY